MPCGGSIAPPKMTQESFSYLPWTSMKSLVPHVEQKYRLSTFELAYFEHLSNMLGSGASLRSVNPPYKPPVVYRHGLQWHSSAGAGRVSGTSECIAPHRQVTVRFDIVGRCLDSGDQRLEVDFDKRY